MKYSLCADIMFVAVGEKGPIWPDTDGIIEAMKLAKKNGLTGIEMFGLEGRDLERIAAEQGTGNRDQSVCFRRSCTFRKS